MNNLGDFIKSKRQELNMSQKDLGDKIHAFPQQISNWENGKADVPLIRYNELAKALNISIYALKRLEGNDLSKNVYMKQFEDIKDEVDAAEFINAIFEDFEVDNCKNITYKLLLKNYALMLFLTSFNIKDSYYNTENNPFDIEVFCSDLESNAHNKLKDPRFNEILELYFEFETNDIEYVIARIYDEISCFINENDVEFRLHLLALAQHIRKKCYNKVGILDEFLL